MLRMAGINGGGKLEGLNMIEEWKDVRGFEDLYEVSNLGNVRKRGYIWRLI